MMPIQNFLRCLCPKSSNRRRSLLADNLPFFQSQNIPPEQTTPPQSKTPTTSHPKVMKKHVNYPFLTSDELAPWITGTRFMFIMRGPPGSGKSFVTECIRTRFPTATVCSADNYWYLESDGLEYQWDPDRVSEAHDWCHDTALEAAEAGLSPLVIDNTNVRKWEVQYFLDLARRFQYFVVLVLPQTPWRFDIESLTLKNIHFVSASAIESKVRNFEHVFPLYYAWFWSGSPSANCQSGQLKPSTKNNNNSTTVEKAPQVPYSQPLLVSSADNDKNLPTTGNPVVDQVNRLLSSTWQTLWTMLELPDVRHELITALNLSKDASTQSILMNWRSVALPHFGKGVLVQRRTASQLHVTAFFGNSARAPGAQAYGISSAVEQSLYGQLFPLQVTGFFVSVRAIGLRVRLPNDKLVLKYLWGGKDQAVVPSDPLAYLAADSGSAPSAPRRPVGCRAHATLAVADKVQPMECGLDLLRVVDAELRHTPGDHIALIPGGSVRRVCVVKPPSSPCSGSSVTDSPPSIAPPGHEYIYVCDFNRALKYKLLFAASY